MSGARPRDELQSVNVQQQSCIRVVTLERFHSTPSPTFRLSLHFHELCAATRKLNSWPLKPVIADF
eukprot:2945003-Pleurochrysis_carterae.AAC.1